MPITHFCNENDMNGTLSKYEMNFHKSSLEKKNYQFICNFSSMHHRKANSREKLDQKAPKN